MKLVIAFVCLIVGVLAVDKKDKDYKQIPIVAQETNVEHDGKFHYHYETGDGTKAVEDGQLKTLDPEHAGEAVQGEYSYVGDDGKTYNVKYTADERGFIPHGDHIPVAPPIPVAIARALDVLATAKPPKE